MRNKGVSLLEVLISIGILSVGLLGVVALIPIGMKTVEKATIADRTGACGRAALRDVKIRGMLDFWRHSDRTPNWQPLANTWPPNHPSAPPNDAFVVPNHQDVTALPPFAIDPLGVAKGMGATLGSLQRISLALTPIDVFISQDDKLFDAPDPEARPVAIVNAAGQAEFTGAVSWLVTVVPSVAEQPQPSIASPGLRLEEKRHFTVAVAVCNRRGFASTAERVATVATIGQGDVTLTAALAAPLKENQWVLLVDPRTSTALRQCKWYRVVLGGNGFNEPLTLAGADWDVTACAQPQMIIIDTVTGVYEMPMEAGR